MTISRVSEEVGQTFEGIYEMSSLLGSGPASRVYRAFDHKLIRTVAIRILNEELVNDSESVALFRERMRRESQVDHENILRVLTGEVSTNALQGSNLPYFVTEFLGGGSLRTMLDTHGPLSTAQTLRIGLGIANGLASAHQSGVIHYDIRPQNLLFGVDANVRIKDFGLARALSESSLTEPAGLGPSANQYGAPELISGGQVDGRCDVYSLALVMAECITGQVPLSGSSTTETFQIRLKQDLELGSEFGPLKDVLEAAGKANPADRCDAATLAGRLVNASEDISGDDPLPLVPTLGIGSATSEMVRPVITTTSRPTKPTDHGPANSISTQRNDPVVIGDPRPPKVIVPAEPASDLEPQFAVEVDALETESILAKSRPRSFGPVTPFGTNSQASIESELESAENHSAEPTQGERSKRPWLRALVAILVIVAAVGGGSAYWWFEVRIPQHLVPRAEGQPVDKATKSLQGLNFVVKRSGTERRDGTTPGQVLQQQPSAGTKLSEGETVRLTVSLGPTLRTIPSFAGLTRDQAVETITATDLQVGTETPQHDEALAEGMVISATVASGQPAVDANGQVPRDTKMDLVISAGPAPRVIPSGIIGASAEQARAALEEIQLVANILEAYDPKAPKGQIISSSAKTGESLARGSKVTLTMSIGPEPIPVPNVVGMTGGAAAATLESAGFEVEGIEGSPSGVVLQTDPTPGEKHQRGTPVRIFTKSK